MQPNNRSHNPHLQSPHPHTRTVIAHRGLCSIFPQNTKQSIISALHTSDLVELDVHLTRDDQVVVFHDRYLSRVTDVKQHGEFGARLKEQVIDDYGELRNDWWVRDFTMEELRGLRVCQPVTYRPQLETMRFQISSLEEIIEQSLRTVKNSSHSSGLLIEIKQQIAASLTPRDKTLCQKIVQILESYNLHTQQGCRQNNLAIVIQSFNIPLLGEIKNCQNRLVQLYDKDILITEELLKRNCKGNVCGIGVTQQNLLDSNGRPQKRVGQLCVKLNYSLYYWTIRDDDSSNIPFGCSSYHEAYLKLDELGVTGFITEFPDKCRGILGIHRDETKQNKKLKNNQQIKEILQNQKISHNFQQSSSNGSTLTNSR